MSERYEYIIFDGRYTHLPDKASVCEICDSLQEAQEARTEYGSDAVIVRFKLVGNRSTEPTRMPDEIGAKP